MCLGDSHYKYLNRQINKCLYLNIFNEAFANMLKSEYFHLKKNGNLNLFVDASFVINLYDVNEIAKIQNTEKYSN